MKAIGLYLEDKTVKSLKESRNKKSVCILTKGCCSIKYITSITLFRKKIFCVKKVNKRNILQISPENDVYLSFRHRLGSIGVTRLYLIQKNYY